MKKMTPISQANVLRIAVVGIAILMVPVVAHAQTGCTDSPENPTVVLALVGSAGACFTSVRRRLKARRNANNQ